MDFPVNFVPEVAITANPEYIETVHEAISEVFKKTVEIQEID